MQRLVIGRQLTTKPVEDRPGPDRPPVARPRRRCRRARCLCPAFTGTVTTELTGLAGHRGAWLLRREVDGGTEFIALTLWESRQSIEAFTGPDIWK